MAKKERKVEKSEEKPSVDYTLNFSEGYGSVMSMFDYPLISPNMRRVKEQKAVVPSSTVEDGLAVDIGLNYTRNISVMEELEKIYFEDPILNAAISIIAAAVTDDGYRIVSGDRKNRQTIKEFLDFLKAEDVFANAVRCMVIYGEAYIEIIYKKRKRKTLTDLEIGDTDRLRKEVVGIRVINPKNMLIIRDSLGRFIKHKLDKGGTKTIAYAQVASNVANHFGYTIRTRQDIDKLTNYQGAYVLFEPEEIIHLKLGEVGDCGYGLSPLYALRNISYQRRQLEVDAARLIHWYAKPIYMFRLGDEKAGTPANAADITRFTAKLNSREPDSHLVTNIFVQSEILGAFDAALDPVPLIEFLREQTGLGLRVPSTLIGATSKGAFGGGVVQAQERMFNQLIRTVQKSIRYGLRSKLFPLICYYLDMDKRKRGVREGGDKRNITMENEMMFDIKFMKRVPDIIFNEIESALDKHKRIVEQFAAGILTQQIAQDAIGLREEEVEDGEYYYEIDTAQQWKLQKKTLDLEQKYAKELTKLEAKLQPAMGVTSSTSSATKKPKGTPSSQPRKGKPTSSNRPARKTEPVGSGTGISKKKVTTTTVSRKPKSESEGIEIEELVNEEE